MFPREMTEKLKLLLQLPKPPPFIFGAPGIGKSEIVQQTAKELGWNLIDVRLLLLDPTDLRGLPAVVDGKVKWLRQPFLPEEAIHGPRGILFFDELNVAPPLVQASSYQITVDRKIGEYKLPDGWRIVAAGNRTTDMAIVNRMPAPLISRFAIYTLDVSFDDWKIWAYAHNVHPMIVAFLNFRPGLLFDAPKDRDKSFPCPRSWFNLSEVMSVIKDANAEDVSSCVGPGVSREFHAFMKIYEHLPSDPMEILSRGTKFKELDKQNALNGMLIECFKAKREKDPSVCNAILKYAMDIQAEMSIMLIRDCMTIDAASIMKPDSEWRKWSQKYSAYNKRG